MIILVYDRPLDGERAVDVKAVERESTLTTFVESYLLRRLLIFVFIILLGILFISLRIGPLSAFGFLFSGVGWIGFLVTIVQHVTKINNQEERLEKMEGMYRG